MWRLVLALLVLPTTAQAQSIEIRCPLEPANDFADRWEVRANGEVVFASSNQQDASDRAISHFKQNRQDTVRLVRFHKTKYLCPEEWHPPMLAVEADSVVQWPDSLDQGGTVELGGETLSRFRAYDRSGELIEEVHRSRYYYTFHMFLDGELVACAGDVKQCEQFAPNVKNVPFAVGRSSWEWLHSPVDWENMPRRIWTLRWNDQKDEPEIVT